ncbi:uncharacterized protein Dwil_GK27244 [Drosophila willistoni]|uniref:Uncharacterized protein n=1 Tax=Drosophila willistoni TaxID=7260 RepID=A0A0Q9WU82_DROWI|nr:uncharacterized protein LOC26529246 [Drosophila willistoni]KRF99733.1 uncharacterized protein Dwil_GK27244 [Drosophila willistoni]
MAKMTPKWFTPCVLFTLLVLPLVTSAGLGALGTILGDVLGVVQDLPSVVTNLLSNLQIVNDLLTTVDTVPSIVSKTLSEVEDLLSSITKDTSQNEILSILNNVLNLLSSILNVVPGIVLPIISDLTTALSKLLSTL